MWWVLALVIMNILWAASYTVMKAATGSLCPLAIIFWRMLIAAIILTAWCAFKRYHININRRDLIRISAVGFLSALSHLLVVTGVSYSQAADASMLYVVEPVWGILLATIVLREKFSALMSVGLLLIAAGIAVLSFSSTNDWNSWQGKTAIMGNLIIVIGLICEGSFSVAIKPVVHRYPAAVTLVLMLWSCVAFLAVPTLLFSPRAVPVTFGEWAEVTYLALFCSVVGYLGWIVIMRHIPINLMYFSIFIQPITGPVIAWFFLGEAINGGMIIAGSLLLAGMCSAFLSHLYKGNPSLIQVNQT